MHINRQGATRRVLLTKRYAFKVPTWVEWRLFLKGLLANMQECVWWTTRDRRLCPVVFSLPGGWLNVMKRAEVVDFEALCESQECGYWTGDPDLTWVTSDFKADNFGMLNGVLVCVDYGH